jgi:hypothetical protein
MTPSRGSPDERGATMSVQTLQGYVLCLEDSSGLTAARARALSGLPHPCTDLAGTAFPVAELGVEGADMLIAVAGDLAHPVPWSSLLPMPPGYVEVKTPRWSPHKGGIPVVRVESEDDAITRAVAAAVAAVAQSPEPAVGARRPSRVFPAETTGPRTPREPRPARPDRYSRPSRPPRPAREPRPARAPRVARVNGTKGKSPPGTCKGPGTDDKGLCWTPAGCLALTGSQALGAGYGRACLKGPCLPDGRCVDAACKGTPVATMFGWLAPVLDYWGKALAPAATATVAAVTTAAQAVKQKGLPVIGAALTALIAGGATPLDPRAGAGGCACLTWPGWVICPSCANSWKCSCPGECKPLPPGGRIC